MDPSFTPDQFDFVANHIASKGLIPSPSGRPWAGETAAMEAVQQRFSLDEEQSRELVRAAVADLFDDKLDNPPRVERRLMIRRLTDLRAMIFESLQRPKTVTEFTVSPVLDSENNPVLGEDGEPTYKKVPTKITETVQRKDPSLTKLLVEIDGVLYKLHNLDEEKDTANLTRQILQQLEKAASSSRSSDQNVTINQIIQTMNVDHLAPGTRKLLEEAAREERDGPGGAAAPRASEKPGGPPLIGVSPVNVRANGKSAKH